jgi:nucleoside-diphosphate-sugar epimerase
VRPTIATNAHSSIAAVGTGPSAGEDTATLGRVTVTEADWNDKVVHECEQLGAAAPGHAKYSASKTLAERAFWKFFADNQPKFDGVALNPAYVC